VKELYYYLDATPTHSYLKMLYKYPQRAFPYAWLVEENRRRGNDQPEFELIDTGILDDDRYFDVFVELRQGRARRHPHPRHRTQSRTRGGPHPRAAAPLVSQHVDVERQHLPAATPGDADGSVAARHPDLGTYHLYADGQPAFLFTDNETNAPRLFGVNGAPGHFKTPFTSTSFRASTRP